MTVSPTSFDENRGSQVEEAQPVRLAVFDFDGTSISGNSPVLLVRHLFREKLLKKTITAKIILWAIAYKFRLPQSEAWVRGLVFSAFENKPKDKVDAYLRDFYDTDIDCRFRRQAEEAMLMHEREGHVVLVISATFEPIIVRAMDFHPFHHQISTRMKVNSKGEYTRQVDGDPVEGKEKLNAIRRYADEKYGSGEWELSYAYGDHHSDYPLLKEAVHTYAVTPDNPLERLAKKEGWDILDWE